MEKKKKAKSGKRTALKVLCIILAIILVLLLTVVLFWKNIAAWILGLNLINRDIDDSTMSPSEYEEYLQSQTQSPQPGFTGEVIDPDDVQWEEHDPIESSSQVINILLIGQDRREGEGRARSDAMILCTINKSTKTLTMTSFLRDMYVQIPGYQDDRINASYAFGGMKLLDKVFEKNFGIVVDGNVEVDFGSFKKAIDLTGGVDINVTSAEANYLNTHRWENDLGKTFTAGVNHLNGEQALAYSRIRAIDSDFGRTNRQRTVITALINKAKGMSLGEMNRLLKAILPSLTTDMSNSEILGYAADILPMIGDLKIVNQRIPADGAYSDAWIRGMLVLLPDLQKNREVLKDCMKTK